MHGELAPRLRPMQHSVEKAQLYVNRACSTAGLLPGFLILLDMPCRDIAELLGSEERSHIGYDNRSLCIGERFPVRFYPLQILLSKGIESWTPAGLGRVQASFDHLSLFP